MDLKALLAKLNALGLSDELAALVTTLYERLDADENAAVTDDELAELSTALRAEIEALAEAGDDDSLNLADTLVEARADVRTEQTDRAEKATERENRAKALKDAIAAEDGDDEGDDGDEAKADDDETGDDGDEAKADDAKADKAKPEPVAAAGKPRPAPRITSVKARRAAPPMQPPAAPKAPKLEEISFVASAELSDVKPGTVLRGAEALAAALQEVYEAQIVTASAGAGDKKIRVGRLLLDGPAFAAGGDRYLDDDDYANARKIAKARAELRDLTADGWDEAFAASGGNCFPLNTDPTLRSYGVKDRPVRDNVMTRFTASRGGIKTIPPLSIDTAAFTTANSRWTVSNDASPSNPATKPYATLACQGSPRQTDVYALTSRLRLGEFNRRFFPELVDEWWDQIMVIQAKLAERYLLTEGLGKTVAGSGYAKAVTNGENFSATRDVLAVLDKASATLRQSRRLGRTQQLQFTFPFWLYDMLRTDLSREVPGASDERLAVAEAKLNSFFSLRNITPIPILDGETAAHEFAIQANSGGLQPWPTSVVSYLSIPGDWLHLDAGTLDLGLYRDSTLVNTNDAEMFVETWEAPHFVGLETWRLALNLCPSGITQAAATVSVCTSGS